MDNQITRRDFLNGFALPLTAGALGLRPLEAWAKQGAGGSRPPAGYPPALTGMRGSHPGSFEVAHGLVIGGANWPRPQRRTDGEYDLVVVGGGLSGLAAAWYFRDQVGSGSKILVLDNHDDFGGHAKRTEFALDGRTLIGYGGSQSIDSPADYSKPAKRLLRALAVDVERFYDYFDSGFFTRLGLKAGVYFPPASFAPTSGGAAVLPDTLPPFRMGVMPLAEQERAVRRYPLSEQSKAALIQLLRGESSFMPDASFRKRRAALRKMPAEDFYKTVLGLADDGVKALIDGPRPLMGISADAMSARELLEYGLLGDLGLALLYTGKAKVSAAFAKEMEEESEPYIFHFPDGNASLARLLVRSLVPGSAPGRSMEDIVQARFDYAKLDAAANQTRIRLHSTAVDVQHTADGKAVEVTYIRQGTAERVRGKHAVLACYNRMIPYICPEVGADQAAVDALNYAEKCPLTYINIALRNWRALAKSGFARIYAPESFLTVLTMDFPVSMGGYGFTAAPEQPALLQGFHISSLKAPGMHPKEQMRLGRQQLLNTSFADFEREIRTHLDACWGGHGLDVDRDVAAITVNRWPHGYAYEYLDRWDPKWRRGAAPHLLGRRQRGRISIANSDSEALAYVNGALDAAHRAVYEQLG